MLSRCPPLVAQKYSSGRLRGRSVLVWTSMPTIRQSRVWRFTVLELPPTQTAVPTSRLKAASLEQPSNKIFWGQLLPVLLTQAAPPDPSVTTYVPTAEET